MVICPYSVHITMANFSPIFQGQNYALNFSGGLFHVRKDIQSLLQVSTSLKVQYFTPKMFGGYIVLQRACNNGEIFPDKEVFSFENSSAKIHSLTDPMVSHMLTTICNCSSFFLFPLKFHILHRKCFVDTSSYSDHVTTVQWLYIHLSVYIKMTNFSTIFKHENRLLKFPIVSFYVKKDDQCQFHVFIRLKVQFFCT